MLRLRGGEGSETEGKPVNGNEVCTLPLRVFDLSRGEECRGEEMRGEERVGGQGRGGRVI